MLIPWLSREDRVTPIDWKRKKQRDFCVFQIQPIGFTWSSRARMFTGLASFVARAYPRSIRHHHASAVFTLTSFQCASSSRIINRGAFSFLINLSWHPHSKPASTYRHIPVSAFSFCAQWLTSGSPSFIRQALRRRKHRTCIVVLYLSHNV